MNQNELIDRNKKLELRWKICLVILILFVITRPVALFIVDHFIHKAAINAAANPYPLLDPARQLVSQTDYIINLTDLRTYLTNLGMQYPNSISIYYEQLNSGANVSVNKDLELFPASLSKLPVAIVVMKRVEAGTWSLNTKLTIDQSEINSDSGDLYQTVKAGDQLTVEELLEQLLIDSDNTADNVFVKNINLDEINEFQQEVGLEDLFNDQGYVSAKQYSGVLRVLYTSDYLERTDSQKILQLMAQSTFKDYLSQGIPANVTFAHKYGENKDQSILADSGIVYDKNRPYMLTVIIKGSDSTDATRAWAVGLMKDISEKAYQTDETTQ